MATPSRLDELLASPTAPTRVALHGGNPAERYSEAQLARLAELPSITELMLSAQPIVRLPDALAQLPMLDTLSLVDCANLTSLDGIDRAVRLRTRAA